MNAGRKPVGWPPTGSMRSASRAIPRLTVEFLALKSRATAPRVSLKFGSSGASPAGVVYVLEPDGDVNVCGAGCGTEPFGDAPVSASSVNFTLALRSLPPVRRALTKTVALRCNAVRRV